MANQSFTQDANNYYVKFASAFNGTSVNVEVMLQGSSSIDVRYYLVIIVVVAVVISADGPRI